VHAVAHTCLVAHQLLDAWILCCRRFKLNACTARLTHMGVTWPMAEAAAKATGADDNAAGELLFGGAPLKIGGY